MAGKSCQHDEKRSASFRQDRVGLPAGGPKINADEAVQRGKEISRHLTPF